MDHASPPQTGTGRDSPGVLVLPPIIPLTTLAIGVVLQWIAPLGWLAQFPAAWRYGIGAALFIGGAVVAGSGIRTLRRHETNVHPTKPALALVTDGVYRRTRNPIYVGGFTALAGIALAFALDWVLLLFVPAFLVLHYGVVRREERYLEGKFGDSYRGYKASVRRYL